MDTTAETLMAADLADRWIDAILSEQPDLLLHADSDEPLGPDEMARNLAQFRSTLIEELAEQPIAFAFDDDDDDAQDEADAAPDPDEPARAG